MHREANIGQLDPAARLQELVGLLKEAWEVGNTANHHAAVNKVELMRKCPRLLQVIDLEDNVGRHEARLDGAEIDAKHLCLGMRIAKVECPDARACADIQHMVQLLVRWDGRCEELPVEHQDEQVVLQVQPVILALVVRE